MRNEMCKNVLILYLYGSIPIIHLLLPGLPCRKPAPRPGVDHRQRALRQQRLALQRRQHDRRQQPGHPL